MGRKMGINTKAVEARQRKEEQKKTKNELIQKKKEDEYWRDDDKHINRKENRKKDREDKLQAERDRKLANKAAYERDMETAELSAKKLSAASKQKMDIPANKVTRHEIQTKLVEDDATLSLSQKFKKVNLDPIALVPNLNRLEDGESATTLDQALELFSSKPKWS